MAIANARRDVKEGRTIPVPRHLRDGHYPGAKTLGNATSYQYAHDAKDGIAAQDWSLVPYCAVWPVARAPGNMTINFRCRRRKSSRAIASWRSQNG